MRREAYRCVGGSDGASLLEDGRQLGHLLQGGLGARVLVLRHGHFALLSLHLDGGDLSGVVAALMGCTNGQADEEKRRENRIDSGNQIRSIRCLPSNVTNIFHTLI